MDITVLNVAERRGHITAYASVLALAVGAQMWIKLEFERSAQEPWAEARDRVLAVLDVA